MILRDDLYGEYEVEAVIEELVNSLAFQRLKRVHMAGPAYLVNPLWNETRYEHSVGVMLLIRRLGGSLEEQIAGLLHDISHTAFSHTVDIALKIKEDNYHEKIKDKVVANSDIPKILKRYGYNSEELLGDDSRFSLLEKELPALCCDRLDYTLREIHRYYNVDLDSIWQFIKTLEYRNNEICINNLESAEWFSEMYNLIVLDFFYHPLGVVSNVIMAKAIQLGLENQVISEHDLMLTDDELLEKLKNSHNLEIERLIKKFSKPMQIKIAENPEDSHVHLKLKPRIIDPTVLIKNQCFKSSMKSEKVRKMKDKAIEISYQGIYLYVTNWNN